MKRKLLKISSMLAVLLVMLSSMGATAFAAEELSVNSAITLQKGDTLTLTINLADCDKKIVGLQMYLNYDNSKLKYVDGSLKFEKFDGVVYNAKLENQIAITWTNVMEEADFSKQASFLSVQFEVVGTGETSISQYIAHMYNIDMVTLSNYKFTYDYSTGEENSAADQQAVITTEETFLNTHTGSFKNYDDGMGDNSPNKDTHKEIKGSEIVTKIVSATRYVVNESSDDPSISGSNGGSGTAVLIIVGVAVIVLAIVAVIIVKKRDDSKKQAEGNRYRNSDKSEQ
ncbi:MAG: hypothetical protein J1E85_05030 [Ruminococcus sp.]|nr:hypothetical protein [Ruminococcus sp.]